MGGGCGVWTMGGSFAVTIAARCCCFTFYCVILNCLWLLESKISIAFCLIDESFIFILVEQLRYP